MWGQGAQRKPEYHHKPSFDDVIENADGPVLNQLGTQTNLSKGRVRSC